jgi:hypothetical protein
VVIIPTIYELYYLYVYCTSYTEKIFRHKYNRPPRREMPCKCNQSHLTSNIEAKNAFPQPILLARYAKAKTAAAEYASQHWKQARPTSSRYAMNKHMVIPALKNDPQNHPPHQPTSSPPINSISHPHNLPHLLHIMHPHHIRTAHNSGHDRRGRTPRSLLRLPFSGDLPDETFPTRAH